MVGLFSTKKWGQVRLDSENQNGWASLYREVYEAMEYDWLCCFVDPKSGVGLGGRNKEHGEDFFQWPPTDLSQGTAGNHPHT